jgi:hypothetical protein
VRKNGKNVVLLGAEFGSFDQDGWKVAGEVAPDYPCSEFLVAVELEIDKTAKFLNVRDSPLTAAAVLVGFSVVEEVDQIDYACGFADDTTVVLPEMKLKIQTSFDNLEELTKIARNIARLIISAKSTIKMKVNAEKVSIRLLIGTFNGAHSIPLDTATCMSFLMPS